MGKQSKTIRNKRKIRVDNYEYEDNNNLSTHNNTKKISKSYTRELKLTILSIFVVTLCMISGSYAMFSSVQKQESYNTITVGTLKVDFNEGDDGLGNIIKLNGAYPTSDSDGQSTSPYSFKINNTGSLDAYYSIKILDDLDMIFEDSCSNNLLDKSKIKVSINGDTPFILGTLESKEYEITNGFLKVNETRQFEIRIWIDENAGNEVLKKHYHGKIVIDSKNSTANTWNYAYSGKEEVFTASKAGIYKLETWGAQGASYNDKYVGGYGGYSSGTITLAENEKLYINVGGRGEICSVDNISLNGGYNGGGSCSGYYNSDGTKYQYGFGAGGGATHIATTSGLLSTFENNIDNVIIVAAGGGGASFFTSMESDIRGATGGSAGGYKGQNSINLSNSSYTCWNQKVNITGATQTAGGTSSKICTDSDYGNSGLFGKGGDYSTTDANGSYTGGGAGLYGGASSRMLGGSGGSSYVGNSKLSDQMMYCYNCEESQTASTRTVTTSNIAEMATAKYAKIGNGYARITFME